MHKGQSRTPFEEVLSQDKVSIAFNEDVNKKYKEVKLSHKTTNYLFRAYTFLLIITIILVLNSCKQNPVFPKDGEINENIVLVKDWCPQDEKICSDYLMAVWRGDRLFSVDPLRELHINRSFEVIKDFVHVFEGPWPYIEANNTGTKLLRVKSNYADVSAGALYELDLGNGNLRLLRDSTLHVSSAVYWHGDETKIVYYRYGNPVGTGAGYYLFDTVAQTDSLLLEYISPAGPSEMLNGFDLHPNNSKLLIPAVQATRLEGKSPKLYEYDLTSGVKDTLAVTFNYSFVRTGLWLRYNSDGSQILYCNFPYGSYTHTTNDDSEVGIIKLPSLQKRVLDVNTNARGTRRSVQLAPNWSPDDRHIVYGSGDLSIEGARGFYSLYILKNVN